MAKGGDARQVHSVDEWLGDDWNSGLVIGPVPTDMCRQHAHGLEYVGARERGRAALGCRMKNG